MAVCLSVENATNLAAAPFILFRRCLACGCRLVFCQQVQKLQKVDFLILIIYIEDAGQPEGPCSLKQVLW